jgi:hypothetical protein
MSTKATRDPRLSEPCHWISLLRIRTDHPMNARQLLRVLLLILLLTPGAFAISHMRGQITHLTVNDLEIRARYWVRAPFSITQSTTFFCRQQAIPWSLLRIGDFVTVSFQVKNGRWSAENVRIEGSKKVCVARIANCDPSLRPDNQIKYREAGFSVAYRKRRSRKLLGEDGPSWKEVFRATRRAITTGFSTQLLSG